MEIVKGVKTTRKEAEKQKTVGINDDLSQILLKHGIIDAKGEAMELEQDSKRGARFGNKRLSEQPSEQYANDFCENSDN